MIPQPQVAAKPYIRNLPNFLTTLRLLSIPFLVMLFYLPIPYQFELVGAIFLLASATDLIDGYIARRREQITDLGKLLDPVADKLLVIAALVLLVEADRLWAWLAILIVGREIAVTALRAIASSSGRVMQAEGMGKLKMTFQVVGITMLFVFDPAAQPWAWQAGTAALGVAAVLALVSAGRYARQVGQLLGLIKSDR